MFTQAYRQLQGRRSEGVGGSGGVSGSGDNLLSEPCHLFCLLLLLPLFPQRCLPQHILSFQLPPAAAGAHVTALYRLTEASRGSTTAGAGAGGGAKGAAAAGGPRATGVGGPEVWSKQVYAAVHDTLRRWVVVLGPAS